MANASTFDAGDIQGPVLNMELLDQYRGRSNNLLERLIGAFLQEAPGFFQTIRQGDETTNFEDLRQGAHALKSCSYNLGAVRLSKVCQEIESAAVERDAVRLSSPMQQIGMEWFEVEQALRGELYKIKKTTVPQPQTAASVERVSMDDFDEDWN